MTSPFYIPTTSVKVLISLHFHQYLLSDFLIIAVLVGVEHLILLVCISLVANDAEHLLQYL